jgi:hypothetical protein
MSDEKDDGHVGRRQIRERHRVEDALIRGLADALEARHRLQDHAAQQGFGDGPKAKDHGDNLFYDLVDLGARSLRELMHLNARANRLLYNTLSEAVPRTSYGLGGKRHVVDLSASHMQAHALGSLTIENRFSRPLELVFPASVELTKASAVKDPPTTTRSVSFEGAPPRISPGATVDLVVKLDVSDVDVGRWRGQVELVGGDGSRATVSLLLSIERPSAPAPSPMAVATPSTPTAKKNTAKKNTAKKNTAKKNTAKKNTAKKNTAKKNTAKKNTAKKKTRRKR